MKHFLTYFTLHITFFVTSYAQELVAYKAFDNIIIKQDDSLMIGKKSGYEKYKFIKEYYYNTEYDKGYKNLGFNLSETKLRIFDVYKDSKALWDTSAYIAMVGKKGFLSGYSLLININEAIKSGEIILSKKNDSFGECISFTDTVALLYKIIQKQKPVSDYSMEYLYRFKNENYKKFKQDEFELDNQKQMVNEQINTDIKTFNDSTVFVLKLELNFKNYDFQTQSFPIDYIDKQFEVIKSEFPQYTQTKIVFTNSSAFENLKMEKDNAGSLIKRRKDKYGNVNRKIYAKVYFKNISTQMYQELQKQHSDDNLFNYIFGNIIKVDVFEFNNYEYNYLGSTTSN